MTVAVFMSAVACKETEETSGSENSSTSQPSSPDSGETEDIENPEDIESGIEDIEQPIEEGDVAFYLPYSKYIAQSVLDDDYIDDEPIDGELDPIDPEEGVTLENVQNPIQKIL